MTPIPDTPETQELSERTAAMLTCSATCDSRFSSTDGSSQRCSCGVETAKRLLVASARCQEAPKREGVMGPCFHKLPCPDHPTGWQPFSSAPRTGSPFLASTKFLGVPTVERIWWDRGENAWMGAQGEQRFDAWMELPTPLNGEPREPHAALIAEIEQMALTLAPDHGGDTMSIAANLKYRAKFAQPIERGVMEAMEAKVRGAADLLRRCLHALKGE